MIRIQKLVITLFSVLFFASLHAGPYLESGLIDEEWLRTAPEEEVKKLTREIMLSAWRGIDEPLVSPMSEEGFMMISTVKGTLMLDTLTGDSFFVPLLDDQFIQEIKIKEKSGLIKNTSSCIYMVNSYNVQSATYHNMCVEPRRELDRDCVSLRGTIDELHQDIQNQCKHMLHY